MTLPPHRIGDKGQRYVVFVHDDDNTPIRILYSPDCGDKTYDTMRDTCAVHPYWHTPFIVDRHAAKVVRGQCLVQVPAIEPYTAGQ